ncbi:MULTISPECIES: hypothetical protein [unclassified Variovorax]|uniref:hypothetical protein n=1 Tax=unclassified Variovorax TaxID=663243 RepID=UPI001BD20595|nr:MULTISPECIES: hypothetical protein [unclassified Variovorax]
MTDKSKFTSEHNAAYLQQDVLAPGQRWYAFDVLMPLARKGHATKFVMTLWNYHQTKTAPVVRECAIRKDRASGSYWYRVAKEKPGVNNNNRKSLWSAIDIANNDGLPMFGILKDVQTKRCSLTDIYPIADVVYEQDGSALWLLLDGEVGCEVEVADLHHVTAASRAQA